MRDRAVFLLIGGVLSLAGAAFAQTNGSAGSDANGAQEEVPVAGEPAQPVTPATEMPEAAEKPSGEEKQAGDSAQQPEVVPAGDLTTVQFVQTAVVGNTFEIESSRLALEKSNDDQVREFAQQMISDHTAVAEELARAAQEDAAAVVNPYLDVRMEAMLAQLAATDENGFDRAYLNMQRQVHEESIKLFEAFDGREGALEKFASETLPHLQSHLQSVQELQGQ